MEQVPSATAAIAVSVSERSLPSIVWWEEARDVNQSLREAVRAVRQMRWASPCFADVSAARSLGSGSLSWKGTGSSLSFLHKQSLRPAGAREGGRATGKEGGMGFFEVEALGLSWARARKVGTSNWDSPLSPGK